MRHTTGSVYGVFDEPVHMYRGTTMAGIVQDEASTIRARLRRRLRVRDAVARPAVHGGLPRSRRLGQEFATAMDNYDNMAGCGSSARTCRRKPTG